MPLKHAFGTPDAPGFESCLLLKLPVSSRRAAGAAVCFLHSFWNFPRTMRFYTLHRKLPRIISTIPGAAWPGRLFFNPTPAESAARAALRPLRRDSLLRTGWGEGGRSPDEVSNQIAKYGYVVRQVFASFVSFSRPEKSARRRHGKPRKRAPDFHQTPFVKRFLAIRPATDSPPPSVPPAPPAPVHPQLRPDV